MTPGILKLDITLKKEINGQFGDKLFYDRRILSLNKTLDRHRKHPFWREEKEM